MKKYESENVNENEINMMVSGVHTEQCYVKKQCVDFFSIYSLIRRVNGITTKHY